MEKDFTSSDVDSEKDSEPAKSFEKKILVKVHNSYRWAVAICDKELVGRILTEGIMQLDLTTQFFRGTEMNDDEVREEIWRCSNEDANFNVVGENSIGLALELGLIEEDGIRKVQGIPFALVLT